MIAKGVETLVVVAACATAAGGGGGGAILVWRRMVGRALLGERSRLGACGGVGGDGGGK